MNQDSLYSRYNEFKGWSESPAAIQPEVFENIVAVAGKSGPLAILEIGFGDGSFLDWASSQGHRVSGTEIRPEAVEAARARGHDVALGKPGPDPVDLVVAIDVLEHLDREAFLSLLDTARDVLKPDGVIVARIPNGYSPFFGRYHHADMTHGRPLTGASVAQMAMLRGFRLVREENPRPRLRGLKRSVKCWLAYKVRDVVEILVGYGYFGERFPMDPNILVVLSLSARPTVQHAEADAALRAPS